MYFCVMLVLFSLWLVMLSMLDGSEYHEPGTVFTHYHFVINMYFDSSAYH